MKTTIESHILGYKQFRDKFTSGDNALIKQLAHSQAPKLMVIACCDSRVDPAILLQCDPGEIFICRNIANLVPPFEADKRHHGTSAALEYGICYLNIEHLIIMGHSNCGGINGVLNQDELQQNDFLSDWLDVVEIPKDDFIEIDNAARLSLMKSYENCLTFPWIKQRLNDNTLQIHLWFLDLEHCNLMAYDFNEKLFTNIP